MNNEVATCVTYGLLRWARAYACAALVKGPNLCQKLSVGTLFAVGIGSPITFVMAEFLLVECSCLARSFWKPSIWRRSAVRHMKHTAIL